MKCISCGAEIGLTDHVCPHCGRVLTETAAHQAAQIQYQNDSELTKRKAGKTLAGNIPLVISAFVMLLLVIGIAITGYVKKNAYHFREDAQRKESVNKYDEYTAAIREYLDAGDYTGFAAFKEYHNIAEWEAPYDDLRLLWSITEKYSALVTNVEAAVMFGPEARRYRPEDDVDGCHWAIHNFYYELEHPESDIDSDPYRDYIYDMKEKADLLLEIYLGLDETGRDAYFAASDLEQKVYLEEVLIND